MVLSIRGPAIGVSSDYALPGRRPGRFPRVLVACHVAKQQADTRCQTGVTRGTTRDMELKILIGTVAWCALLLSCWPLGPPVVVLWPTACLLTFPFCLAASPTPHGSHFCRRCCVCPPACLAVVRCAHITLAQPARPGQSALYSLTTTRPGTIHRQTGSMPCACGTRRSRALCPRRIRYRVRRACRPFRRPSACESHPYPALARGQLHRHRSRSRPKPCDLNGLDAWWAVAPLGLAD